VDGTLNVPKRQVRVSLTSVVETVEGFVFLSEFSEHTQGPERVGELLNHPDSFLPLRDMRDERVYLHHKGAIVLLTVTERDWRDRELGELGLSPAEEVEITLVTGHGVTGLAYLDPRREHSRVSDLLNRADPFVVLLREEGVTYVAKGHILRVA
jgi:hypothetical protein